MPIKKTKINTNLSDETKSFHEKIDEVRSLAEETLRYTKNLRQSSLSGELAAQKELQQLLKENLKVSKDLYAMVSKINKWVYWQIAWGTIKTLIIIIPIALGVIYLPALLNKAIEPYRALLNLPATISGGHASPSNSVTNNETNQAQP